VPRTIDDLGVPASLVHDLALRAILTEGRSSTYGLSERLALSPILVGEMLDELRDLRYIEVLSVQLQDRFVALTDEGRRQALERMQLCRYAGAAPVSLDQYRQVVLAQRASPELDLDQLHTAFSDLVIADDLLRELGPAVMGKGAMFLYGPPGTGKSSIAERLGRVHGDKVVIPHAIEVDGQIVLVYDPIIHRRVDPQPTHLDPRWVVCERPTITVGGELTGQHLDLAYQAGSGLYQAPIQMQANNGILVIDDFGRQVLTPEQLLNRWIVPLDRGIDYLALEYGTKFDVPFDAKIVFSTNLAPESLGDEAFFRRIESKVLIPPIDDDQFDEVLHRVASAKQVTVAPGAPQHLRQLSRRLGDGDLRPYLPAVVFRLLEAICKFEGTERHLDEALVERIGRMYFTRSGDDPRSTRPEVVAPMVDESSLQEQLASGGLELLRAS
jgi:predicted ATPase with chaperone activity